MTYSLAIPAVLPAADTHAIYRQGQWVTVTLKTIAGRHVLAAALTAAPTADPAAAVILDAWEDQTAARAAYDQVVLEQTAGAASDHRVSDWYGRATAASMSGR